ncbi:integrase arm-type DNA-binding domain-containing protein [Defluviimonas sp. WL0002]|uniref:Integrase arm-type DNA-binding domain-containing protein n=1 Tax=Albidovulum marisflavi TaxID=2984159 RepID=A0ABT2ZGF0_9RHOB|nr:integrase arm-type DNA-binding domain-containing protein [Defluviimonas sp. WL0002]MCV2870219.1 integrase arm-type DNA-binding domain-containing protein [Defluviimonas sp. WL0002]
MRYKLSSKQIERSKPGKYADGDGLWFVKRSDGGAQWVFRYTLHDRRPEMGLGKYPEVGLAEARESVAKWRAVLRDGQDPIKVRNRQKREAARADNTLSTVAREAFEARKAELKDDGKAGRWFSPLEMHVLPKLGTVPIEEIDQNDLKRVLAPIWHDKADAAKKALTRLSIVMRHAAAMGLEVDLLATEKTRALLGKSRHVIQHIPALPWKEVPDFYASLNDGSVTHLALRLLVLSAARSKPVRFCRMEQIAGDVWTIPAELMKGRKGQVSDFRVPLSQEALGVIEQAKPFARDGYLFPSIRKGVISDATWSRLMERRGMDARPHGFRTSFRTWLAEATDAPEQVAETCLAHVTGTKVARAYQRSDFLEQRRVLMERWADFVTGGEGKVVQMVRK